MTKIKKVITLYKIRTSRIFFFCVNKIIHDSMLVQKVLDALPNSYKSFASILGLMIKGSLEAVKLEKLIFVLQSRQDKLGIHDANQGSIG